jgi:hypothetical protein
MPTRYASHDLRLVPDYRFFTIRDADSDAGVDADQAITESNRNIAAGTGYELYVTVAQDLIPVDTHLEIWDAPPPPPEGEEGDWSPWFDFTIACPTGLIRLGDATANAIAAELPDGPGVYHIQLRHHGRQQAMDALRSFNGRFVNRDLLDLGRELHSHAGLEQYHLRMWRATDLPDDDEWDNEPEEW